ncbi:unnamed protein product [Pleuronectes platessa]|uniref:Uncharacterized protein n=1 Tax=Pleuronectes platessa TaxID=8262 RepID=A0A9N7UAI3_PLEPL|nr:unnamed protein product [Pleuronectes platessa]
MRISWALRTTGRHLRVDVMRYRYELAQACRLLGCMEIRRNTAEKQVMEERGRRRGKREGKMGKEEEESGAMGLDNEDSDEWDREP